MVSVATGLLRRNTFKAGRVRRFESTPKLQSLDYTHSTKLSSVLECLLNGLLRNTAKVSSVIGIVDLGRLPKVRTSLSWFVVTAILCLVVIVGSWG